MEHRSTLSSGITGNNFNKIMRRSGDNSSAGTTRVPVKKRGRRQSKRNSQLTARQVNSMIDKRMNAKQEKKYNDTIDFWNTATLLYPFSDGNLIVDLTDVASGALDVQRVGDQITLNSCEVNWMCFAPDNVNQSTGFFIRVTILQWDDEDPPIAAQIMQDTNPFFNLITPWDHDHKGLRTILYDKKVMLFDNRSASNFRVFQNNHMEKDFIDMRKMSPARRTVKFIAGTTSGYNKLWMQVTTNLPVGSQPGGWPIYVAMRVNYTDS